MRMKNFTLLLTMLFICSSAFSQAVFNWELNDLGTSSNLKQMTINGSSAIIAGYSNTFIQTLNNGTNWNSVGMMQPENNIPDISVKGNVGYIVSSREKMYDASPDVYLNGAMLKTEDGGATWSTLNLSGLGTVDDPMLSPSHGLSYGYDFQAVETINDSTAYCALKWYEYGGDDHSGIFRTADGGGTWMNISGDLEGANIKSISYNGEAVFVGGQKKLFKSALDSDTLMDIFARMPGDGSDYIWDITVADTNDLFLTTSTDSIYFSNDGGETFNKYGTMKGGWDTYQVNDSTIVVAAGSNKSYVSTDLGQNWNLLGLSTSMWDIPGMVGDSLVLLASEAVYKIAESDLVSGNYNFSITEAGNGNLQAGHIAGNTIIAVGNDLSFIKSDDGGKTWSNVEMPENPEYVDFWDGVDFDGLGNNGDDAFASFNRIQFSSDLGPGGNKIYWSGGIFYTDDNWESWNDVDMAKFGKADADDVSKNPNHDDCNGLNPKVIEYLGGDTLLVWAQWYDYSGAERAEHSRIFRTEDNGKNWVVVTDDIDAIIQDMASDGNVVYAAGKATLLKSVDGGRTFTDIYANLDPDGTLEVYLNSVCMGDNGQLLLSTYSDGLWQSKDGGNSFNTFDDPAGAYDSYIFDSNSYMALGSSTKSYFTNDGGATWENCGAAKTCYAIGGVLDGTLYGLSKGKYYTLPVTDLDLRTAVEDEILSNQVSIRYGSESIVVASSNTIEKCWVYNLSGQLMTVKEPYANRLELMNSSFTPGVYIIATSVKGQKFTDKVVFK